MASPKKNELNLSQAVCKTRGLFLLLDRYCRSTHFTCLTQAADSGLLSQKRAQFDLAVHGGGEAGAAVHGRAPVHGDHRCLVTAQRQHVLQPVLSSVQPVDEASVVRAGEHMLSF